MRQRDTDKSMKPTVYIETTIPSYLTSWRSSNVVMAGRQEITLKWWQGRDEFELYVSELVLQEAGDGNCDAAARRIAALQGIPLLASDERDIELTRELIREVPFPSRAESDAAHIAIAAVSNLDYLLTWNFTHIANVTLRERIRRVCESFGFRCPEICTPEELLGGAE